MYSTFSRAIDRTKKRFLAGTFHRKEHARMSRQHMNAIRGYKRMNRANKRRSILIYLSLSINRIASLSTSQANQKQEKIRGETKQAATKKIKKRRRGSRRE
jgi:hypothetical protein